MSKENITDLRVRIKEKKTELKKLQTEKGFLSSMFPDSKKREIEVLQEEIEELQSLIGRVALQGKCFFDSTWHRYYHVIDCDVYPESSLFHTEYVLVEEIVLSTLFAKEKEEEAGFAVTTRSIEDIRKAEPMLLAEFEQKKTKVLEIFKLRRRTKLEQAIDEL